MSASLPEVLQIREANIHDLADILTIKSESQSSHKLGSSMDKSLRDADIFTYERLISGAFGIAFKMWIATVEGKAVGWQCLLPCRENPLKRNQYAESSTYTIRRPGIPDLGTILLRHALHHAASISSLGYIVGYVDAINRASHQMVRRCGFELVGSIPGTTRGSGNVETSFYVYVIPDSHADISERGV